MSSPEDRRSDDTRIRALLLSPVVAPAVGGIASFTTWLEQTMSDWAQPTVCGTSTAPSRDSRHIVTVTRPGGRANKYLARARFARSSWHQIRTGSFDLVHALTWKAAVPWLFAGAKRPPLILHCLGAELVRGGPVAASLRRRVLRGATAIVAISTYTGRLAEGLTERDIDVVPPGTVTMPESVRSISSSSTLSVLAVGELVPPKGHAELIDAVERARGRGADLTLTIVGEGPLHEELDALIAARGASSWARLTGRVSDEELDALYSSADIFALLTKDLGPEFEGFGLVFVEAAAYGLPIVAGASGGSREAMSDDNAWIVSGAAEAADALTTLSKDPERRRAMSEAGRRFASRHQRHVIAEQLRAIYERVLRSSPNAAGSRPSGA